MRPSEWPDWLRRAIRTAIQVFAGVLLTALGAIAAGTFPDLEWWVATLRAAGVAAVLALATSVLTGLQNALEDSDRIPSLLKSPASAGALPLGIPISEVVERHVSLPEPPDAAPPERSGLSGGG
jgi:hypothetical protein